MTFVVDCVSEWLVVDSVCVIVEVLSVGDWVGETSVVDPSVFAGSVYTDVVRDSVRGPDVVASV